MNRLVKYPLVYLATPYTKYRAGLECAFRDAAALAARLMTQDVKVYSPISHTHPLAIYGNLDPRDHSIWLPFESRMMVLANALLVAQLRGWNESYGIKHEVDYFLSAGKPVFYLDTVLMRVATTPWEIE